MKDNGELVICYNGEMFCECGQLLRWLGGKMIGCLELHGMFACLNLPLTFNKFCWITVFNFSSLFALGTTLFFSNARNSW